MSVYLSVSVSLCVYVCVSLCVCDCVYVVVVCALCGALVLLLLLLCCFVCVFCVWPGVAKVVGRGWVRLVVVGSGGCVWLHVYVCARDGVGSVAVCNTCRRV